MRPYQIPFRPQDNAVRTARGAIRVPTVIVAVNFARVPKKRLKLLTVPRAPQERPVSALLRNALRIAGWRLFLPE